MLPDKSEVLAATRGLMINETLEALEPLRRRVKIHSLTRSGCKQLHNEEAHCQRATSVVERFVKISADVS